MPPRRSLPEAQAVDVAATVMTRAFGSPVTLADPERIGAEDRRNLVVRARAVVGGTGLAVIVKATRDPAYDPHAVDAFAQSGLVREWVARLLLGETGSTALLAGDTDAGLIVFADLGGDLHSLVAPLLHGTPGEAEAALTAYAVALAGLHARTLGCGVSHAGLLRSVFPAARLPRPMGAAWFERRIPALPGCPDLPADEVGAIRARLADPGSWLALAHGDNCPDNVLLAPERAELIDFEASAPGHALLDAVYWRLGFPTCWCAGSVPEAVAGRVETAYRSVLAAKLPEAADDTLFHNEIAAAMVARLLNSLHWLLEGALDADGTWGIATRRARILHYLPAVAAACTRAGRFPRLADVLAAWEKDLRARWPDIRPLALYPAFGRIRGAPPYRT